LAHASQVSDEFLVRIAGRHHSLGVVGIVVQSDMPGICVEDRNDSGVGIPFGYVVSDELKVEDRSRKIPPNANAPILKAAFTSASCTGMSM
jgi:hypothetical protein